MGKNLTEMLRESKLSNREALVLPTWKWRVTEIRVEDPWYTESSSSTKRGSGRVHSSKRGIAAVGVCDLLLIAILLLLLLLINEQDYGRCNLNRADMKIFKKAIFNCQELLAVLKKKSRGMLWESFSTCNASAADVFDYFNHTHGGACPDSPLFAERMRFVNGCNELPRRNCRSTYSSAFPREKICNQLKCLGAEEKNVLKDCDKCTNSQEVKHPWDDDHHFGIDEVLNLKEPGLFRIGLDASGGSGKFAAIMAEKGTTILTQSSNLGGEPLMEALAFRGLPALHFPLHARLPVFEGSFDIVHYSNSSAGFSIDTTTLDALLYEWDRVLRPHGFLWVDTILGCDDLITELVELIDEFGYKKLKWRLAQDKHDIHKCRTTTFSAVLEKPQRSRTIKEEPLATMT